LEIHPETFEIAMISSKKTVRILAALILMIALSACRVATPTQVPVEPPTPTSPPVVETQVEPTPTSSPSQTPFPLPLELTSLPPENSALPTDLPLETPLPAQPESEPETIQAATPVPSYGKQADSPVYLPNFGRPEMGCNWMGVAGQVFGPDGNPMKLVVVNVSGILDGQAVANLGITGNALAYGPGGYEVDLNGGVKGSTQTIWVQLTDLQGKPISDRYYINTFADCQKNLILLNFSFQGGYRLYFPVINR